MSRMKKLMAIAVISHWLFIWPSYAKDAPHIVVDIRPVAGLVAQVIKDIDMPEPVILLKNGVSVHDMNLRPSQARNLQSADIVFLIGAGLITGLERSAKTLAGIDKIVTLMDAPDAIRLGVRRSAVQHQHHHDSHHDEKGHGDHHEDEVKTAIDPHGWLDPENAAYWLSVIAENLSRIDPVNEAMYSKNAKQAQQHIRQLQTDIARLMQPAKGRTYLVAHDSLAYFDRRFEVGISAVLTDAFSEQITPGRLGDVLSFMAEHQVECIVTDPETTQAVEALFTSKQNSAHIRLDLFGYDYPVDDMLYQQMMLSIASNLANCGAS